MCIKIENTATLSFVDYLNTRKVDLWQRGDHQDHQQLTLAGHLQPNVDTLGNHRELCGCALEVFSCPGRSQLGRAHV